MEGIELSALTPSKSHISPHGGTESGTLDPALDRLIQAWPGLPEHIREQITELVENLIG